MVRTNTTIMCGVRFTILPGAPCDAARSHLLLLARVGWPRIEAIALAERMAGDSAPTHCPFLITPPKGARRLQGAHSVAVSARQRPIVRLTHDNVEHRSIVVSDVC